MEKIVPCIWFDQAALEAVKLYVSLFDNSRINVVNYYYDELFPTDFEGVPMPEGTVLDVDFELCGQRFAAVNGGPIFSPNPSISFYVLCETSKQLNMLHEKLLPGGFELMELGEYPFSKRYCWLQDRFGVSWQLILATGTEDLDTISPCLLFVGKVNGYAEESVAFYSSLFDFSSVDSVSYYGKNEGGDEGAVLYASFHLAQQSFVAMDSNLAHPFQFSEGISLMITCDTQEKIDYFWGKLVEGGEEQPCGWLKDKYGVSWQVVPSELTKLTDQSDRERAARVNRALLTMTKIDLQTLRDAFLEKSS